MISTPYPPELLNFAAIRQQLGVVPLPAMVGRCSSFGGPHDSGVTETETGAISGERLRQIDPDGSYCAMRWGYRGSPEKMKLWLADKSVVVYGPKGMDIVRVVDWGPNKKTGRIIDLSPGTLRRIGANTDSLVVCHWLVEKRDVWEAING